MHLIFRAALCFVFVFTANALKCWNCNNAQSYNDCVINGRLKQCQPNQMSCQTEIRRDPQGIRISKGCKNTQACENNARNNPNLCKPEQHGSYCVCCCENDNCNRATSDCSKEPKCERPTNPANGAVSCPGNVLLTLNQECTYSCNAGYILAGNTATRCTMTNTNTAALNSQPPTCRKAQCTPTPLNPENGVYECTDGSYLESRCEYACNPGFAIVGEAVLTCTLKEGQASWSTPPPICQKVTCQPSQQPPLNGGISCTADNAIGSVCTFYCNAGYSVNGSAVLTCEDNFDGDTDGVWSSPPPTCYRQQCNPAPVDPENGVYECNDGSYLESRCEYRCNPGFAIVGEAVLTCTLTEGNPSWSTPPPICQIVSCDLQPPPTNGGVLCTEAHNVGSVCTYDCDAGYALNGSAVSRCVDDFDGDTDGVWTSPPPICFRHQCSPQLADPENGFYVCSDGSYLNSRCEYGCNPGFAIVGEAVLTCTLTEGSPSWSTPPPICQIVSCDLQPPPINGGVLCTAGHNFGSVCTFHCNAGYSVNGSAVATCQDNFDGDTDGVWSSPPPICQTETQDEIRDTEHTTPSPENEVTCSSLDTVVNGNYTCTDQFFSNSVCTFQCDTESGYHLIPANHSNIRCLEDGSWDQDPPCCDRSCPPYAAMDFVLILDSSSSVKRRNWNIIKRFGKNILQAFDLGEETGRMAVFRYNKRVDTNTQILLKDHLKNRTSFFKDYDRIPYNGGGTLTGQALRHAKNVILAEENGNRPSVVDVVLTITDGRAQDDVGNISRELRANGALTYVIGVQPGNKKKLDENELLEIAGRKENMFLVTSGFAALDQQFAEKLSQSICTSQCGRPPVPIVSAEIQCLTSLSAPTNGSIVCSDGYNLGSRCEFACEVTPCQSFTLVGNTESVCLSEDGLTASWSHPAPTCIRTQCSQVPPIPNGRMTCLDGNFVNSVCTFHCETSNGYSVYPETNNEITCLSNGTWDKQVPCCSRQCPPYAAMDFVLILDSSSSVKRRNWNIMKRFGKNILNSFNLGDDTARMAVFRYNKRVDINSQVQLKDFPTNKTKLFLAYDQIPYNGGGTLTGQALRHAKDVMFSEENGNRPGVVDVVLTITDGRSQDHVRNVSRALRANGVLTYVIGIQPGNNKKLDKNELLDIAGSRENMFLVTGGFSALDQQFAYKLSRSICTNQCGQERPREITCDPEQTSLTNGGVTCTSSNHLNSECSFACNDGYMLSGSATSTCNINLEDNEHGSWSNEPPVCQEILCTAQNAPMNGHTSCTGDVSIGTVCSFICPSAYKLVGEASSTCEEVSGNPLGIWSNDVPSCQPIVCTPQQTAPTNGDVSCDDDNLLNSVCTFTCNSGHVLIGSPTTSCNFGNTTTDGVWSHDAAVCQEILCTAHAAPENGGTSCIGEVALGTVCSFSCSEGYRLLGPSSSTCGENNNVGTWNKEAPTCERLSCSPTPEAPSNGNVSCSDGDFINSICSFTCSTGFTIIGPTSTTCQTNDSSEVDWNKPAPVCQPIMCQPHQSAPTDGSVSCTNENYLDSVCTFTCSQSYAIIGAAVTSCMDDGNGDTMGEWSVLPPTCERKRCPTPPSAPLNGFISCTPELYVGSSCEYECDQYHRPVGPLYITCVDQENAAPAFDNTAPVCERIECDAISTLKNGHINCTDDNFVNSVCTFQCDSSNGYFLFPANETTSTCLNDTTWNKPTPCCARSCPPYASMDFVMVVDSSSSIGRKNWRIMKEFGRNVLNTFVLAEDAARMAVFRYNRKVDNVTQVLLNDHIGDKDAFLAAYDRINYNGRGTWTGQALQHAKDVMLAAENGNRADIKDVVLTITDGRAQDNVVDISKQLRDMGVLTYAVGIVPGNKKAIDRNQLIAIAGSEENLFMVESGFQGLDEQFASKLARSICTNRCGGTLQ